jgi:Domain of unknown function (DUF4105)
MRGPVALTVRLLAAALLCVPALAAAQPLPAPAPPAEAAAPTTPATAPTAQAAPATPEAPAAPAPAAEAAPPATPETPAAPFHPDAGYLPELLARARAQRTWDARLWHVLMHYERSARTFELISAVDNADWFLSPHGRKDPQAELEATLTRMFDTELQPRIRLTVQCAYPARGAFLRESLAIDAARLPQQSCPRFEAWRKALDPDSVSLVFASYFFNNPASMFGHTFLLLHTRGRGPDEEMLNYTINFGAEAPKDIDPVSYALLGLTGGFTSFYHLLPYYAKIKEYNDIDKRDLWEYPLDFTPQQIERLLQHDWEMNWAKFDYYFLDENCSYHLLTLIEAADPSLHLRESFQLYTLPSDAVQVVLEQKQAQGPVHYRPSRRSLVTQKLDAMSDDEAALVFRIVADPAQVDGAAFQALPPERQALVLDAAIDYHQLSLLQRPAGEEARREALRALLIRRSRMTGVRTSYDFPPVTTPPHLGHDGARLRISGGASGVVGSGADPGSFVELNIQPAFHEQMSRDVGFPPWSQTIVLRVVARYERPAEAWRFQEFNVLNITSISPYSRLNHTYSWQFDGGWERNRDVGCEACTPFHLHFGMGYAAEGHALGREVVYALVHVRTEMGSTFARAYRAGMGLQVGALYDPADRLRLGLFASGTSFSAGSSARVASWQVRLRYALSRNAEVALDAGGINDYREASLALGVHF